MNSFTRTLLVLFWAAGVCISAGGIARAQGTRDSENTTTTYVAEVEGGNEQAALSDGTYKELGRGRTRDEAQKYIDKYNREHPNSLRLTRIREIKARVSPTTGQGKELLDAVIEAKNDYDRAKRVANGDESLFRAEERKLGDTIKEYGKMLKDSLRRITETKQTMSERVDRLTKADFDRINRAIDKYNREVADFQAVVGRNATGNFKTIPRLGESDFSTRDESTNLEGKEAQGKLGKVNGGTTFFARFKEGGVVMLSTGEEGEWFTGTWTQSGNTITMRAGSSKFSGTLHGNRISGARSRVGARRLEDTEDTWYLDLSGNRR